MNQNITALNLHRFARIRWIYSIVYFHLHQIMDSLKKKKKTLGVTGTKRTALVVQMVNSAIDLLRNRSTVNITVARKTVTWFPEEEKNSDPGNEVGRSPASTLYCIIFSPLSSICNRDRSLIDALLSCPAAIKEELFTCQRSLFYEKTHSLSCLMKSRIQHLRPSHLKALLTQ